MPFAASTPAGARRVAYWVFGLVRVGLSLVLALGILIIAAVFAFFGLGILISYDNGRKDEILSTLVLELGPPALALLVGIGLLWIGPLIRLIRPPSGHCTSRGG